MARSGRLELLLQQRRRAGRQAPPAGAGVAARGGGIASLAAAEFERVMRVNTLGPGDQRRGASSTLLPPRRGSRGTEERCATTLSPPHCGSRSSPPSRPSSEMATMPCCHFDWIHAMVRARGGPGGGLRVRGGSWPMATVRCWPSGDGWRVRGHLLRRHGARRPVCPPAAAHEERADVWGRGLIAFFL